MTDASLDSYYSRMSDALDDKRRVLPYITGHDVLDVGCGSGDLLATLTGCGYNVYGIDASFESVERAAGKGRVAQAYADELSSVLIPGRFDTVICSSVFHEVFSYGNRDREIGKFTSVSRALSSIYDMLKPGGRLIIRDGVRPDDVRHARIWVDKPEEVEKFLRASPFSEHAPARDVLDIRIQQESEHIFRGSPSSLMEFAFTYTWGPDSFEREVQEYYGLFTLDNYSTFVGFHGFENITKYAYTQPGYQEHLNGKVYFLDTEFPKTNAIWVYEKI